MTTKWKNTVPVVVFCAGLAFVFSVNLFTSDRTFSEQENRTLQTRPHFSIESLRSGEFSETVEEYITDQFMFRDAWLGIKWYADLAIGKKESNGIYLAAKDTLIPRLEYPEEDRLEANINAVNRLADNLDLPLYFALIPTSAHIWKEKLPYGAPNCEQEALLGDIYDKMRPEIESIDIGTVLSRNKDEEIFYRTDHHWSTLGAYYGYEQIMLAMGRPSTAAMCAKASYDEGGGVFLETVSTDFLGTSQSRSGAVGIPFDDIKIWEKAQYDCVVYAAQDGSHLEPVNMYNLDALKKKDQYRVFFDGNQPEMIISGDDSQSEEKILIIKDSYANSMIPFMVGDFAKIYVLDMRFMKKSVSEYVIENDIDTVLVVYGIANFVTDPNIMILK